MKDLLFNGIRLHTQRKGLNNELKSLQSKANELFSKAQICPIGQLQIPMAELRNVINESGETKVNGYEVTPTAQIITKARYLEGLAANALYPVFRTNCSRWSNEQESNQDITHVLLKPHRLYSEICYDFTLINSTDVTVQNALTQDLINDIYNKVEKTLLSDSTETNGNPKGILTYITPTTTTALSISDFTTIEKAYYQSGANEPIYIFSPSAFKTTKDNYKELFVNGKFNDINYVVTSNLQDNYILLCDTKHLLIGLFGGLDVQIDDVTQIINGKVRLTCNSYWDFNITNKDAFQAIKLQ